MSVVRHRTRARRSASSGTTVRAKARCSSASPRSCARQRVDHDRRQDLGVARARRRVPSRALAGATTCISTRSILGLSKKEIDRRFDEIVEFSGLEDRIDTPVKNYSSGMYVRLGFSVAINVDPEILLDRRDPHRRRRIIPAQVRREVRRLQGLGQDHRDRVARHGLDAANSATKWRCSTTASWSRSASPTR